MTEEELDAAVDVISAVDAGLLQSLNQRIKQRNKPYSSLGATRGHRKRRIVAAAVRAQVASSVSRMKKK